MIWFLRNFDCIVILGPFLTNIPPEQYALLALTSNTCSYSWSLRSFRFFLMLGRDNAADMAVIS